jgi:hypothetical protein
MCVLAFRKHKAKTTQRQKQAAKEKAKTACHRVRAWLKIASRKKLLKTGEAVFVQSAQTVAAYREKACWYGETVSGQTIYSYVGGNPLSGKDPLGLQAVTVFPGGDWPYPPPPGLQITHNVPPCSASWTAQNGSSFYAPANANWSAIYAAGQAGGYSPFAANTAVGQFGTYDFQRNAANNMFLSQYTNASNFGVGVYMNGAGFSMDQMLAIGWAFSMSMSSNAGSINQASWWIQGWEAANANKYPSTNQSSNCGCK